MKILIINGSPRANGATGQILTSMKNILRQMDDSLDIEYIDLGKMDLKLCTGCLFCYKTGNCFIKDDGVENLSHMIDMCDGVIFGSPTYASNVSGHFKVLIDRGHFVFEQLLKNKACFSVVTYENADGKKAQKVINSLIHLSGGAVSCQYLRKINHGNKAINEKDNVYLLKLCEKFLVKAKQKNPLSIFEKIFISIVFNVGLKPHALKNESRYKGVIDRWMTQGFLSERG